MTPNGEEIRQQDPATVRSMFNSIAPTYDLLNHLLSFGLDIRWRRKAIAIFNSKRGGRFLDIAAGSGDISLDLLTLEPEMVVAADFAVSMLEVFRRKLDGRKDAGVVHIVSCDAHHLPFSDNTFDGTIVAFGIRNFADRPGALREMLRVLKPGGITVILELTRPLKFPASFLYRVYTSLLLPMIGAVISRHNRAYRYLPESITGFPPNKEFIGLMSAAGFIATEAIPLTFGAATIYKGMKKS